MMSFIRWSLVFCLLVCIIGTALSQSTNSGDIRGTVTDSSGAVVPGVAVAVLNLDTGTTKELVTNSDGLYDTASILPGNYQVTFAKEGFGKIVRGPITLQVGIITVWCIEGRQDSGNDRSERRHSAIEDRERRAIHDH
jgi:hypothetical protein